MDKWTVEMVDALLTLHHWRVWLTPEECELFMYGDDMIGARTEALRSTPKKYKAFYRQQLADILNARHTNGD